MKHTTTEEQQIVNRVARDAISLQGDYTAVFQTPDDTTFSDEKAADIYSGVMFIHESVDLHTFAATLAAYLEEMLGVE